jgi:uncharacterized protein YkwD
MRLSRGARRAGTLFLTLMFSWPSWPQVSHSGPERNLFESLNSERRKQGLHTLKWNRALATAARRHAQEMSKRKSLEHRLPGEPSLPARATKAGVKFVSISENIVRSASAHDAHGQFMKSPAHRANVLDRDMDSVGVGVAKRGGELFVVEDFAKAK